jgi:mevalonate kinase
MFDGLCGAYDLFIVLDIPLGCGLGSSAVISVLFAGFQDWSSKIGTVLDKAMEYDGVFHGISSGVDVYVSFNGGLIKFRNKHGEKLQTEFLRKYKILIYDSKLPKKTSSVVKHSVHDKKRIYAEIEDVAIKAHGVITRDFELRELYPLIRRNQDLLEELGVCPEKMKHEIIGLRRMGIEAKVTGAGGGGHMFTIVEKDKCLKGWTEVQIDSIGLKFID